MRLPESVYVSILAFVILLLVHTDICKPMQRALAHCRLLLWMTRACMASVFIDILCVLSNGNPGPWNHVINYYGNLVLFKIDGIPSVLWLFYILLQMDFDARQINRIKWAVASVYACSAVLGVVGLKYGWLFYIDQNNVFHRGEFYWLHVSLCYLPLFLSLLVALYKKKSLGGALSRTLVYFLFPITAGGLMQFFYNGAALTWGGLAVSMLALYFNIQNKGLMTDYLTGIYNRRQLDQFLLHKIRNGESKDFAAVLIDLDGFKTINDTMGHSMGDQVLRTVSQLLRESLRRDDFIARFGGDEFCVVLDIDDPMLLEEVVERIRARVRQFNQGAEHPFRIQFSMGYDIYRRSSKLSMIEFLKHIDTLMYKQKKRALMVEWPLPPERPDSDLEEPAARG
ncbi:MAG: GGDEF domain-containing protein [Bacillota bacterium]